MAATIAGLGAVLAGIGSLRLAWGQQAASRPWLIVIGWTLLGLAIFVLAFAIGGETGVPLGALLISTVGLGIVLANREIRPRREVRQRDRDSMIDPSDRKSRWWRGVLRVLLAGPLSGAAAILVGVALAKQLPLEDVDAIAIGALAVPLLWAGGMAWTLSDDRILRALVVITCVSAVSFALAFLV